MSQEKFVDKIKEAMVDRLKDLKIEYDVVTADTDKSFENLKTTILETFDTHTKNNLELMEKFNEFRELNDDFKSFLKYIEKQNKSNQMYTKEYENCEQYLGNYLQYEEDTFNQEYDFLKMTPNEIRNSTKNLQKRHDEICHKTLEHKKIFEEEIKLLDRKNHEVKQFQNFGEKFEWEQKNQIQVLEKIRNDKLNVIEVLKTSSIRDEEIQALIRRRNTLLK